MFVHYGYCIYIWNILFEIAQYVICDGNSLDLENEMVLWCWIVFKETAQISWEKKHSKC